MIVVQLIGGLGNQMFQYAAGRSLAYRHNTELKLDISKFKNDPLREYGLSQFNIIERFATEKDFMKIKIHSHQLQNFFKRVNCKIFGKNALLYTNESHFNFDPDFFTLPDNVYLEGYWQSEKYFSDIKDIIHDSFKITTEQNSANKKMSELIERSNSVSIHIRRGDYISDAKTHNDHGVCPQEYYNAAIEKIDAVIDNPLFFIFSDDPFWVQKEFKIAHRCIHVNINYEHKSYEDLRLITLCKNHIIANSSFSWWGAWLSNNPDKIVYAPKKWFNNLALNTVDLIPSEWKQI